MAIYNTNGTRITPHIGDREVSVHVQKNGSMYWDVHSATNVIEDAEKGYVGGYDRVTNSDAWFVSGDSQYLLSGSYTLVGTYGQSGYLLTTGNGSSPGEGFFHRGDDATFLFRFGTSGRFIFLFGKNDTSLYGHYELWLFEDQGEMRLVRGDSGNHVTLASTSVSFSTGTPYYVSVDYDIFRDGELWARIWNDNTGTVLGTVSAYDSTYSGSGFGYYTYSDQEVHFDNFQIR